jgi:hypothetical protein
VPPYLLADGCCNARDVLVALGKHSHIRDGQLQGANALLLRNQTCTHSRNKEQQQQVRQTKRVRADAVMCTTSHGSNKLCCYPENMSTWSQQTHGAEQDS